MSWFKITQNIVAREYLKNWKKNIYKAMLNSLLENKYGFKE